MGTLFHALLILCTIDGAECAVLSPTGSPYTTRAACDTRLAEGRKEVTDPDFVDEFAATNQDIRFVCHEAPKDWNIHLHTDSLLKLYGKPKGEKS